MIGLEAFVVVLLPLARYTLTSLELSSIWPKIRGGATGGHKTMGDGSRGPKTKGEFAGRGVTVRDDGGKSGAMRGGGGRNGVVFSDAAVASSGAVAKSGTVVKLKKRIVITIHKGIEIMEAKIKQLNPEWKP